MTSITNYPTNDLRIRIWREFEELPGLRLTLGQACRLWAGEPKDVGAALQELVTAAVLRHVGPYYVRADLDRFCN